MSGDGSSIATCSSEGIKVRNLKYLQVLKWKVNVSSNDIFLQMFLLLTICRSGVVAHIYVWVLAESMVTVSVSHLLPEGGTSWLVRKKEMSR